jgi:Uma2 family endonuclease
LEEEHRFEWVNGHRVERVMGAKSSRIGGVLFRRLDTHAQQRRAGLTFPADCGYQIFPDAPKQVRYPDVSFVRSGRLPNDEPPEGHMRIPPDLAVEVVSPNDLAEDIEARVMDYLRVGVPLVWVIYPVARCARVLRQGGASTQLTEADDLSGEDVVPGFACRVGELFAMGR